MSVILFDIDGTLLHTGGAGKIGMESAFAEIFGIKDGLAGIQLSGRTDPQILEEAIGNQQIQATDEDRAAFKRLYLELLQEKIKDDLPGQRLFPGIGPLLARLSGKDRLRLGLLTGNWRGGAETKLGHFDIDHYFGFGAYGDDHIDRNELLPFALRRCSNGASRPSPEETIVIGDTPMDVRCAQVHGAKALAVATGQFTVQELAASHADWVFEDLGDVDAIVGVLTDSR